MTNPHASESRLQVLIAILLLLGISAVSLYQRIPYLDMDILGRDRIREATDATITKNLYEHGLWPSSIRSDVYASDNKDYISWRLEFPTYQAIVALTYKFTGVREINGKIVNCLFFYGALLFLFLFMKEIMNWEAGVAAFALAACAPLSIYYSCTFQRVGLLALSLTGFLYFWARFLRTQGRGAFWAALIFASHACLLHYSRAFVVAPFFIASTLHARGWKALRQHWFYWFLPGAGLAPFLWLASALISSASLGNRPKCVPGLRDFGNPAYYLQWITPALADNLWIYLIGMGVGVAWIGFAVVALLKPWPRQMVLVSFALGVFAFIVMDSYPFMIVLHAYYLLDAVFLLAALAGAGLACAISGAGKWRIAAGLAVAAAAATILSDNALKGRDFRESFGWETYGDRLTKEQFNAAVPERGGREAAIIAKGFSEVMMYQIRAQGWLVEPNSDPAQRLPVLKSLGCQYAIASIPEEGSPGAWLDWLSSDTLCLFANRRYAAFDLRTQPRKTAPPEFELVDTIPIQYVSHIRETEDRIFLGKLHAPWLYEVSTSPTLAQPIAFQPSPFTESLKGELASFGLLGSHWYYMVLRYPNRFQVLDHLGALVEEYALPPDARLRWTDYDANTGRLVASDMANHCVWFFNRRGEVLEQWGREGHRGYPDRFINPGKVLVRDGQLLVADGGNQRLMIYDARFRPVQELGRNSLLPVARLYSYCPGPNGSLFLASDSAHNVTFVDSRGWLLGVLKIEQPWEVHYSERLGLLFVASWGSKNAVFVYKIRWPETVPPNG